MSAASAAPATTESRSPETWSRRREWISYGRRNPTLIAGLTIITVIVVFGLLAPFIIDQDATRTTAFSKDLPPSLDHPLGTDSFGRDMLALIVVGTPQTVKIGLIAGFMALIIGSTLGFIQGFYRGPIGTSVRGVTDITLTIPALLILITVASQVRQVTVESMAIIIALLAWPGTTRAIGSQVLSMRERAFVPIARFNGMSGMEIIFKELMPNMLPYLGASFVAAVSTAILFAIGLEVLGLGPQTTNTLGMTIYWSQLHSAVIRGLWWWWLSPMVVIVTLFIGLFLISHGLDELANPRLRRRV